MTIPSGPTEPGRLRIPSAEPQRGMRWLVNLAL